MKHSCMIIGLGKIGMDYDYNQSLKTYSHAKAISKHPKFNLIGAVDLSINQLNKFNAKYSLPTFEDLELSLNKLKPEIIIIATPTDTHSFILNKILKLHKPKIILCEKPLSYDYNLSRKMVQSCKELGVKLFVNYMRTVDKGVLEIKKRIVSNEITTPIKANVWYSKGLYNNGSHFINLLNFWLGDVISTTLIDSKIDSKNIDPVPEFKINFELGSVVFQSIFEDNYFNNSLELISRSGRLNYLQGGSIIKWQSTANNQSFMKEKPLRIRTENIKNSMQLYQYQVYEAIHDYLNGSITNLCTGNEALYTLGIIHKILKSKKKK